MNMVSATPFTRRDYMRLPEGFPAQLIEGVLVKDPSPVLPHQILVSRLHLALAGQVNQDRVLVAPLDLFLDDENIYQPDLMVFDQEVRLDLEVREAGRPALVVEVLSPLTAAYDCGVKSRRYLEWGVREVWLVDPGAGTIEIRSPGDITRSGPDGVARSVALDGLVVDLARLFRN